MSKVHNFFQYWLGQWSDQNTGRGQSFRSLLIRIGSMLLLYVVLDRILMRITHLPLQSYYENFIYFAFLKHVFTNWYLVFLIATAIFLIFFRKDLFISWTDLPKGKSLRILIVAAAGILTWSYATSNYNLYFDRAFYPDRLLLFIFLLLIYWRPVFVLPFLTVLLPIAWQVTVLPYVSLTAPSLLFRIIILFSCFLLIYPLTKKFLISDFVFLTGCLVAAHYWSSGLGKFNWNWIRYDQISFMLPDRYPKGWLVFLEPDTIASITQTLSWFNLPMKIFTLIVEFGAFLFFLHRRSAQFFLGGFVIFHLGVFFVSGFFFWMWMLIEVVLLWLFFKKGGFSTLPIFSKKHLIISIFLIVGGTIWVNPPTLAWFDIPVSYTYRFEAETADGKTYRLPGNFFAPYDYQFSLNIFMYLNPKPMVPYTFGTRSSAKIALKVMELESEEEVFAFEESDGKIYFDAKTKEAFEAFIRQYIQNWNKRFSNETWLSYIQAPRLLQTYPTSIDAAKRQPIKRVVIVHVTSFYREGRYSEIRQLPIDEILID